MRFIVRHPPRELTDWGVLGGIIGRAAGSYWEVPVLEGIDTVPTSDELKHFGAAMASYGSVPLFHMVGVTPEAGRIEDVFSKIPTSSTDIAKSNYEDFRKNFSAKGEKVDVVVFAAPQLSLMEISQVAALLDGRRINKSTALFVCTSPGVASDCDRMGLTNKIETCGGKLLRGTCFYQQFAREIAQANGWHHLISNSAKIVNIIGGYGYKPSLASMEKCIESAIKGVLV
jgi:predicted aconitase